MSTLVRRAVQQEELNPIPIKTSWGTRTAVSPPNCIIGTIHWHTGSSGLHDDWGGQKTEEPQDMSQVWFTPPHT